jgi:hypothetical protein
VRWLREARFCCQSCSFIMDLQIGLYARCCSILENHLWKPKQTSFSIVMDNVDCWWEVVEGVLGIMSLGAPRQAGRQAGS